MLGEPPRRVFVVDSGMTFGAWEYNPLGVVGSVWMSWKAQAIHPSTLRKLHGLTRRDLAVLRTVAQLELDANGVYRSVPASEPWQDAAEELPGVRRRGGGIQLGLTPAELDETYEQTRELLAEL